MRAIRHGDVILYERAAPAGATLAGRGRVTLAEGEATGHAHVATGPVELWEERSGETWRRFLRVLDEGGVIVHEEHATVALAPGDWEVVRQREWTDDDEPRQVAD